MLKLIEILLNFVCNIKKQTSFFLNRIAPNTNSFKIYGYKLFYAHFGGVDTAFSPTLITL